MKHTHITAQHGLLSLDLREVWEYRELVWLFAKRTFQVSYKQTVLGPLWLIVNPLLTSLVYVVLFGNIARLSTDGVPQLLFYLSGNALWTFFADRVRNCSAVFTGNARLFGKVYFPRLAVPVADVVVGIVRFGIQMILVVALYVFYFANGMVRPDLPLLAAAPALLIVLGAMGMGFGIIVSSLTTRYRDLSVLVGFGLQLWMFATPVVYPMSALDGTLGALVACNPVSAPMELFRAALFGAGTVTAQGAAFSLAFAAAVLLAGMVVFKKVERTFIDTV